MLTLHRLNAGYRVLYTGVLLFFTAGTTVHAVHQHARAGLAPGDVAAWYRGNADDPAAEMLLFPRPFEEVFGDVWLALTTYALALLVFGAILSRSRVAPALRAGLVSAYALAAIFAAASPLLIRYVSAAFSWLDAAALVALPLLAAAMTGLAAHEMWLRRGEGPRFDARREV